MIAILGGLGAAVLWATSNLTVSRASRLIGSASTVAWMMLVGTFIALPLAAVSGPVPAITPSLTLWTACSGLGGVIGLLLVYQGLRIGKIGVVTALTSTEGAIAAVIAVFAGERLTLVAALMLGVIAVGVVTVALTASASVEPGVAADEKRAALCGALAACAFGISIYGTGQVGLVMPPLMAVLPVRIAGVVLVLVPLALTGRLRLTRPAVPMVVIIGAAEVFGNASYVVGARDSIAVSAVLGSQFAAVAAVAAFFLFRERLSMGQRSGIVAIAVGVALLTAVRG
jgi:drug/metabolite transporter (DMT)-like permease